MPGPPPERAPIFTHQATVFLIMNRRKCFIFFTLIYFSGYMLAARDFYQANVPASFFSSMLTALEGMPNAAERAGERRRRVVMISEPKIAPETGRL
jgi:hypothetical protein